MSLSVLLLMAQSAFAAAPAGGFDGHCTYPAALGEPGPGEVWVTCSRVELDEGGIDFVDRAWNRRMLRFGGEWNGNLLTVRTVTPRSGTTLEVRGVCRIFYANEAVSVIACTAVSGSSSWMGNFKVSRL